MSTIQVPNSEGKSSLDAELLMELVRQFSVIWNLLASSKGAITSTRLCNSKSWISICIRLKSGVEPSKLYFVLKET